MSSENSESFPPSFIVCMLLFFCALETLVQRWVELVIADTLSCSWPKEEKHFVFQHWMSGLLWILFAGIPDQIPGLLRDFSWTYVDLH